MKLFLAPHNDDETLFGAFTIMREKPSVVVIYDSMVQEDRGLPIRWEGRRSETMNALNQLGCDSTFYFAGISDNRSGAEQRGAIAMKLSRFAREHIEHVYAPAIEEGGHEQHNLVGRIADELWPGKVTHYLTYTRHGGKSRSKNEVPIESGDWIIRKHRALACYTSQITVREAGCWPHFMEDLREYYADPK